MSDQAKFLKMLELLMILSGNIGYSIKDLAEKFTTSPRTIFRYLSTFKDVGFKVIRRDGYYRIDKKESNFKDISELIHFSKEEAIILSKAIHLIIDEKKLKNDLYRKLYYLFDKESIANQLIPQENSDNNLKLNQAIKTKQQVILKNYSSSNSNSKKDRIVEPFQFTTIYDSVWAFDIEDQICKTFKIARIAEVTLTNKAQSFNSKHHPLDIDPFRFSGNERISIEFTMSSLAYNLMIEEYPLSEEFINQHPDGSYIFSGWVYNFIGVSRFILGLMDEIEIISPYKLKSYLNSKIENKIFL